MFPGLKVDEFCVTFISSFHFFFFSFINDIFLLLVNRDKIQGSMSLNFTSVPSWINDLIALTIFSLEF
jgi:hypothetical protein